MMRSLIAVACLAGVACTEPRVEPRFFEGTITQVFKVIDTFQDKTDYTLTVDQDPANADPSAPCADRRACT